MTSMVSSISRLPQWKGAPQVIQSRSCTRRGVHFEVPLPDNRQLTFRIRNDAAHSGACGMERKRELTEQFENGIQFGTCNACGWEYQCPPLLPNDKQAQGALDRAFDQHSCAEHLGRRRYLHEVTN